MMNSSLKVPVDENKRILVDIKNQFLSGIPLRCFDIDNLSEFVASHQEEVLFSTIHHELNRKYPLKQSYQLSFLKNLINMLESKDIEVIEDMYLDYVRLLNEKSSNEEHYLHFYMNSSYISLKEKTSIISNGTTGLAIWPAGKILAKYCIDNLETFQNKSILEFGCGLGFTGIATIMVCKPKCYCFTDVHSQVLFHLVENIKINLPLTCCNVDNNPFAESILVLQGMFKDTGIAVMNHDLKNNDFTRVHEIIDPDYILAADIVYDRHLFIPLSRALAQLLKVKSGLKAIVACTIRNIHTLEEFSECLHELNVQETLVQSARTWNSSYDYQCEVRIFCLQYCVEKGESIEKN